MQLTTAARRLNMTYRKADHWASQGYIRANFEDHNGDPVDAKFAGTGYIRMISSQEFQVLRLMNHLVTGGITPAKAAEYARKILDGKIVTLGPLRLAYREGMKA